MTLLLGRTDRSSPERIGSLFVGFSCKQLLRLPVVPPTLAPLASTHRTNPVLYGLPNLGRQYAAPVLRNPYHVVLAMAPRAR